MRAARIVLVIACMTGLSGCGSVVYTDAATTFTVAGRAATKALGDASSDLSAAQDRAKAQVIVADKECPIQEERIFLRQPPQGIFAGAIKRIPDLAQVPECLALATCDMPPANKSRCAGKCYSVTESFCIRNLEGRTAATLQGLSGEASTQFLADSKALLEALDASEYRRHQPASALVLKEELASVLRYFDLLDKSVKASKPEVDADAKNLGEKTQKGLEQITKAAGTQLSTTDAASLDKTAKAITAFGAFVNDAEAIAAASDAARQIRENVAKNGKDVGNVISALHDLATGDEYLAAKFQVDTSKKLRKRYADKFAESKDKDTYQRALLLEQRDAVSVDGPAERVKAIDALFDAMQKANDALTQLVLNPSDKDKEALRNARFQEFKLLAVDVASFINTVK